MDRNRVITIREVVSKEGFSPVFSNMKEIITYVCADGKMHWKGKHDVGDTGKLLEQFLHSSEDRI